MAADNLSVQAACKILGVAESGFYAHRTRAPSERTIRHTMLTDLITQIHTDSHGIYGGRRVHAELTLGRGVIVGHNQVQMLMRRAGLAGLTGRRKWKRIRTSDIATDLVERDFTRAGPNQLWVTDITEHPTREGKIYCCVILDTYSRRVVGWSIDSSPTGALVTNALGMAIDSRLDKQSVGGEPGTVIHSDHGVQGGFNRLSQHPEFGGVQRWRRGTGVGRPAMRLTSFAGSGVLIERCGRRCARRVDRSRRARCSGTSGR